MKGDGQIYIVTFLLHWITVAQLRIYHICVHISSELSCRFSPTIAMNTKNAVKYFETENRKISDFASHKKKKTNFRIYFNIIQTNNGTKCIVFDGLNRSKNIARCQF